MLAQGLVSRAGSAGGRTGGLAVGGAEKAVAVPFTAAGKKQRGGSSMLQMQSLVTHDESTN